MPQNRPLRERGPLIWRSGAGDLPFARRRAWREEGARRGRFARGEGGKRALVICAAARCFAPRTAVRGFAKILLAIVREESNIFPCLLKALQIAGWSSLVARRAHNPEVVGSNPAPATMRSKPWLRPGLFDLLGWKIASRTSCIRLRRRFCGLRGFS